MISGYWRVLGSVVPSTGKSSNSSSSSRFDAFSFDVEGTAVCEVLESSGSLDSVGWSFAVGACDILTVCLMRIQEEGEDDGVFVDGG